MQGYRGYEDSNSTYDKLIFIELILRAGHMHRRQYWFPDPIIGSSQTNLSMCSRRAVRAVRRTDRKVSAGSSV